MGRDKVQHWYDFYKPLKCRVGLHEWVTEKYRKKNRMLISWEECCICRKVKEEEELSWSDWLKMTARLNRLRLSRFKNVFF